MAQQPPHPNWDNQIYMGNKVAGGTGSWRYSGEWQVRLEDNMQQLDNWFVEGAVNYLYSKKLEIVPDFRFSIKPTEVEFRPGFGILFKHIFRRTQLVHQVKWQVDADNSGNWDNGLRYAVFVNHKIATSAMITFAAGAFYRWQKNFNGFQYIRFGPGVSYIVDFRHTLNFNYLISATNKGNYWAWAGIPVVQLVINIGRRYRYVPAKYYNF